MTTVVFLSRYPTLLGYCLVAPRKHVEDWARGLSEHEFLTCQRVVHRLARAIASAVPTERVYSLALGSEQANAHVHWHVAPLPPGVPYEQQARLEELRLGEDQADRLLQGAGLRDDMLGDRSEKIAGPGRAAQSGPFFQANQQGGGTATDPPRESGADHRHTKALGVPPRDAMEILGHSRIAVTLEVCTAGDDQSRREAIERTG